MGTGGRGRDTIRGIGGHKRPVPNLLSITVGAGEGWGVDIWTGKIPRIPPGGKTG